MRPALLLSLFFSLLLPSLCGAQGQQHVWAFGDGAGLDFNGGTPLPAATNISGFGEASASVCNASGQLLFYTEGSKVWNRNGVIMPGGADLTGLPLINGLITPTSSATQGALIVPVPDTPSRFYLFSLSSQPSETGANSGKLFYSVVDMDLDGGLGDIVPGRKGILIDSGLTEKMTGIVGDRCNIWLLVHQNNTLAFKAYEITSAGLNPVPVVSSVGASSPFVYTVGAMKCSPDRKRLALANILTLLFSGIGSLELFDFDPASGVVSSPVMLSNLATYGACFSPDNSRLYASEYNSGTLSQYDLSQGTPAAVVASKTVLAQSRPTDIKQGPDGKLYLGGSISAVTGNGELVSVINAPNNLGAGCQLQPDAIQLAAGTSMNLGLPNEIPVFSRDTIRTSRDITVCFKDSVLLISDTLGLGWDHEWSNGAIAKNIYVSSNGSYVARYHTPPCVYHADTFKVDFSSPMPAFGAFSGCKGAGNSFLWIEPAASDTNLYTYTWTDSLGATVRAATVAGADTLFTGSRGLYHVTMAAGNGCDTSFAIRLDPPDYKASFTADSIICIGQLLSFSNTSTGLSSFRWYFGDGDSSLLTSPDHLYLNPGRYTVMLVGAPCSDTATMQIVVDSMSYVRFSTDAQPVCEGEMVLFTPEHPPGAEKLKWDFGDGSAIDNDQTAAHAYDSAGVWIVSVTASFRACPDTSFSDTVEVYPYPRVDVGRDNFLCLNGDPLLLSDHNAHPAGYEFLWNTGDTSASILARHPGVYTLRVTSDKGCGSSDSMELFKGCYLDIPNAFTPDGDGNNDYFLPRQLLSRQLTAFHMSIFNRWGQLIFETERIDGRGWDGKLNGKEQPAGVYVYLIEAVIDGDKKEHYQGNVTLLR